MRHTHLALVALLLAFGLLAAGCGSEGTVGATPETVEGTVPETARPSANLPALELEGDATAGKAIFASAGCGSCHTLSDAGSSGAVGPNLDDAQPSYELTVTRVTEGRAPMPGFKDSLTAQQIADVSQYVVTATGG
jgi:mono/diheme cytochrome c family protein